MIGICISILPLPHREYRPSVDLYACIGSGVDRDVGGGSRVGPPPGTEGLPDVRCRVGSLGLTYRAVAGLRSVGQQSVAGGRAIGIERRGIGRVEVHTAASGLRL